MTKLQTPDDWRLGFLLLIHNAIPADRFWILHSSQLFSMFRIAAHSFSYPFKFSVMKFSWELERERKRGNLINFWGSMTSCERKWRKESCAGGSERDGVFSRRERKKPCLVFPTDFSPRFHAFTILRSRINCRKCCQWMILSLALIQVQVNILSVSVAMSDVVIDGAHSRKEEKKFSSSCSGSLRHEWRHQSRKLSTMSRQVHPVICIINAAKHFFFFITSCHLSHSRERESSGLEENRCESENFSDFSEWRHNTAERKTREKSHS